MIPGVFAGQMRVATGGGDPHWASVTSLLHFDGADGSTAMVDQKGRTWTAASTAQLDTDQYKFGPSSLLLLSAGQYISTPTSSDFAFGTGDFTIEFWFRAAVVSGVQVIYDQKSTVSETQPAILLADANLNYNRNNSNQITIAGITAGTWHHVAVSRSAGATRMFLNGVAGGTVLSDAVTYPAPPTAVYLGTPGNAVGNAGFDFGGHIDEVRVTKGVARYVANFTPAIAAFPNS